MDRCVNCGIATGRSNALGRRALDDETTLSVIRQWLAPQPVNRKDYVCQACWTLAQTPPFNEQRQVGHRNVCLLCGRSISSSRCSHLLHTGSTREMRIYNVIGERVKPRTVEVGSRICHTCWVAADRAAVRMYPGPSAASQGSSEIQVQDVPLESPGLMPQQTQDLPNNDPQNEKVRSNQSEPTIVLPEYKRATETESRCFIAGCRRTERYRVPLPTRKMLLNQHKYYVPENNRLCDKHLVVEAWDFLDTLGTNFVQTFTAKHIQDMLSLKEVEVSGLVNFESVVLYGRPCCESCEHMDLNK